MRNEVALFLLLSLEETMGSRQFCSKEEKRIIHIIRGREVMSIRRCACSVVYTRGVSPTHLATQTIKLHSLLMRSFRFGSASLYMECSCSRTKQMRNLLAT
uniref:Secreted protein n=1 Tax=Brassica oleracea var. oleracea TaxID=109376 RepID=A0A0D3ABK1_BRAOL